MPTFKELGLRPDILKALDEIGFETPTEIQLQAIPQLLTHGEDLIAFAQTGTGKTAAFSLPIIDQAEAFSQEIQALVLCPTRELCIQITKDMMSFSKYVKGINIVPVYGGTSIDTQIRGLKKGAQIVVGTPGRVLDLINRRKLRLQDAQYLVLDEADEMLSMGFKDDLDAILEQTPPSRQTLLFSATMPRGIKDIAKNYMRDPKRISAGSQKETTTNVHHIYFMVKAKDRYETLKRIADVNPNIYGIVFCRTRRETKEVADKLMQDGYNADALHGDLSQAQRDHVMGKFRKKHLQMLVATDVAARGLDVNDLTHVINYNLPDAPENYVHRSGRTGRAGKTGISMAIIHSRERNKIRTLEKKIGRSFEKQPVPDGKEICKTQLFHLIDNIKKVEVNEEQIAEFLPLIAEKLEGMDGDLLIKKIVSVEFNKFLSYYNKARDLNIDTNEGSSRRRDRDDYESKSDRRAADRKKFGRLYINIGSKNKFGVPDLMGLVNRHTRSTDIEIGKIDIMKKFTFFDVDKNALQTIIDALNGQDFNGKIINIEETKEPPKVSKKDGFKKSGSKSRYKGSDKPFRKGPKRSDDKPRGRKNKYR